MKTKKLDKKLPLNKKTIAALNDSTLNSINAGGPTYGPVCNETGICDIPYPGWSAGCTMLLLDTLCVG